MSSLPPAATSADRLNLALSASGIGDWSWDARSDVVQLSPRAAEIFGVPADSSPTARTIRNLLHPDDREADQQAVDRALATRGDYSGEYRIVHGTVTRWIAARGRGLYDEKGALTGMIGVVLDITERRRMEAQLARRTRSLETVNRVGLMVAAELDLEKIVSAVTDAATQVSGAQFGAFFYNVLNEKGESYMLYTLSGVDRSHFANFPMPRNTAVFAPTFNGEGTIRLANVMKDRRYGKNDTYHGMPKGHLPVVSYLAVPVLSRDGEVLGGLFFGHHEEGVFDEDAQAMVEGLAALAAVAIDNTRLHERAQRSRRAAEDANRLKDDFLATLSHELRTPLTSIVGWVHLLRTGRLSPEDTTRAIDTIARNAHAQQQIIEDILDVSRIMTGKLKLELAPVDARAAVEAAVDALRPLAQAKEQQLLVEMAPGETTVLADGNRLQQVIWNLVSNAVKFTPRSGRIAVSVRRAGDDIEIAIADNGEGIEPAFLPHVFDRFKQQDASTTRKHGGIGLGLSIVRHLLDLQGGTIEAHSAGPGQGSRFVVKLPVAASPAHRDVVPQAPESPPPNGGRHHAAAASDIRDLRVLVIEDEADSRTLFTTILARAGAEVQAAGSASGAFAILPRWKPQVIVSDIGMPGEDGLSFMQRLRRMSSADGGDIPAAALTAYARAEDCARCLAAGFQSHLAKPVDPDELLAVVARLGGRPAGG